MLIVVSSAWFRQTQLVVSVQCGQFMPQRGFLSMLSPNPRLQRTPLRVARDWAFFSASFCYNVVAMYRGGAANAQPVGRQLISASTLSSSFTLHYLQSKRSSR